MDKYFTETHEEARQIMPLKETHVPKSRKKFITNIIVGCLFLLCVFLDIFLLTSNIYEGTYHGSLHNDYTNTIIDFKMYKNTFTYISRRNNEVIELSHGFYVVDKSEEKKYLLLQYSNNRTVSYEIKSVFKIKVADNTTLYCHFAIFLQVLYCIIIVSSILYLVIGNRQALKIFIKNIFD